MAQRKTETAMAPGAPKPYQERPRFRPKPAPRRVATPPVEPPVRSRLAWSRAIIDQNCNTAPAMPATIPPVRSMAALRARAGTPADMVAPHPGEPPLDPVVARPFRPDARDLFPPTLDPASNPGPLPLLGHRLKDWIKSIFK